MKHDTIKELWIEGLRTLTNIRLRLSPLTVLTGDNGSGKSTIVEACEILRRCADPHFLDRFISVHGGLDSFKSYGSKHVRFGVRIEGNGAPLEYSFTIEDIVGLAITTEHLREVPEFETPRDILKRSGRAGTAVEVR